MAHEVETAFYVKQPAWHRVGKVLQDPPTIEDAIIQAGLDWQVIEKPLFFGSEWDESPDTITYSSVDSYKALVRETDGSVLGVVGHKYQPLQNIEAFEFFDEFISSGEAKLEAAGSLKGGKRVWVLAKISGQTIDIIPNDPVDAYLCLYNSHDGSLAVGIMFTPIRVVCQNTLQYSMNLAESKKIARVTIRHTAGLSQALKVTKEAISLSRKTFDFTVDQYRLIQKKSLPIDGVREYVREIFEVEKDDKDPRCLSEIEQNHAAGMGADIKGVRGTYWGAFNAFTEWLDHQRGRTEDNRLDSTWFGQGAVLRRKAFEVALSKATGLSEVSFGGTMQ